MEMPGIKWPEKTIEEKVPNETFLNAKLNLLDNLISRLRPYRDLLFQLNGIRDRRDIREVIGYVLREFAAYFWDLPASRIYHHSGRWGLLHHSLEVALKQAAEAAARVAVDREGNPSAESGKKHRGEQVLIAWLAGLFHDSGKIFDMDLTYSDVGRDVYYHPMRGNVLGFKLKHPDDGITIRWRENRGMRHARRNLAVFMNLIPLEFLQQLKIEQFATLVDKMIQDGNAADRESVAEARTEEDREYVRQAIRLFARDGFRAQDRSGNVQPRVFALGQNTYVLVNPVALQALVKYCRKELGAESFNKDQVTNYLIQNKYVYSSEEEDSSGNYFLKVRGYINKHHVAFHAVFATGDLFAEVDVSRVATLKLEYSEETWEGIKRIVGFPPPYEWFHNPPESEDKSGIAYSDSGSLTPDSETDAYDPDSEPASGPDTDNCRSVQEGQADESLLTALKNLSDYLESGEVVVNRGDDERNIGFISANDGHFWGYHSAPESNRTYNAQTPAVSGTLFVKKLFRNTGIKNSMEALQKLEEAGCLAVTGSESVIESHTRFKSANGLEAAPPAKYIRLNMERMTELAPELRRFFFDG